MAKDGGHKDNTADKAIGHFKNMPLTWYPEIRKTANGYIVDIKFHPAWEDSVDKKRTIKSTKGGMSSFFCSTEDIVEIAPEWCYDTLFAKYSLPNIAKKVAVERDLAKKEINKNLSEIKPKDKLSSIDDILIDAMSRETVVSSHYDDNSERIVTKKVMKSDDDPIMKLLKHYCLMECYLKMLKESIGINELQSNIGANNTELLFLKRY